MKIRPCRNRMSRFVATEMRYFHRPFAMSVLSCCTAIIVLVAALLSLLSYIGAGSEENSSARIHLNVSVGLAIALLASYIIYRIIKWGRLPSYSLMMSFTAVNFIMSAVGGFLLSHAILYHLIEESLEGGYVEFIGNVLRWSFWAPAAVIIFYFGASFVRAKTANYDGGWWYVLFVFLPLFIIPFLSLVMRMEIEKEDFVTVTSLSVTIYVSIMLSIAARAAVKAVMNTMLLALPVYEDAVVVKSTYRASDGKRISWWEKKPPVTDDSQSPPDTEAPVSAWSAFWSRFAAWFKRIFSATAPADTAAPDETVAADDITGDTAKPKSKMEKRREAKLQRKITEAQAAENKASDVSADADKSSDISSTDNVTEKTGGDSNPDAETAAALPAKPASLLSRLGLGRKKETLATDDNIPVDTTSENSATPKQPETDVHIDTKTKKASEDGAAAADAAVPKSKKQKRREAKLQRKAAEAQAAETKIRYVAEPVDAAQPAADTAAKNKKVSEDGAAVSETSSAPPAKQAGLLSRLGLGSKKGAQPVSDTAPGDTPSEHVSAPKQPVLTVSDNEQNQEPSSALDDTGKGDWFVDSGVESQKNTGDSAQDKPVSKDEAAGTKKSPQDIKEETSGLLRRVVGALGAATDSAPAKSDIVISAKTDTAEASAEPDDIKNPADTDTGETYPVSSDEAVPVSDSGTKKKSSTETDTVEPVTEADEVETPADNDEDKTAPAIGDEATSATDSGDEQPQKEQRAAVETPDDEEPEQSEARYCGKCGIKLRSHAEFCHRCGQYQPGKDAEKTESVTHCGKCGATVSAKTKFCNKCGFKIS